MVAQKIKQDSRLDLFAATPPLEAKKPLFSWAVTKGIGYTDRRKSENFVDVRRAYFQAPSNRKVYIRLPQEDNQPGMVGILQKSTYGTRDAAQNWGAECTRFIESIGFKKGMACACSFWHERKELRAVVHGDDFAPLGWSERLDWLRKEINNRFERKNRRRIGPAREDDKPIRIQSNAERNQSIITH